MSNAPERVVVEADGGSRGNPGPAAYGALLRDADTGALLAESAATLGTATNNVAEYRGLIAGLELVREHAPEASLEVRMDSKLVIEQMAGRWKVKHASMRPLAIQARRLAPEDTVWTWVPRAENAAADALVNAVLDGTRAIGVTRPDDDLTSDDADRRAAAGHRTGGGRSAARPARPAGGLAPSRARHTHHAAAAAARGDREHRGPAVLRQRWHRPGPHRDRPRAGGAGGRVARTTGRRRPRRGVAAATCAGDRRGRRCPGSAGTS